jgi:tripartite ATP-independent transporter DctP family solute receptor
MKRTLPAVLALALILAFVSPACTADKRVTLKFSNVSSESTKEAGELFKQILEKESKGSIIVNLFPDNVLGDDRMIIESTMLGDIDIAGSSTSPLSRLFPDFYLFDGPFVFLNVEDAYAAMDGLGESMLKVMENKGLKGIAFWENGFRNLTNNKVAARVPADVKNMKIRTMENDVHLAAWRAFGANPTPMAYTELFTALQKGTVDGQENPLGLIASSKLYEAQKYVSLTQHVYTPYVVCMNLNTYNSLSDAQRAALKKAFKEATAFQRKRSQELEKEILIALEKYGTVVTHLTPEEKAAWQKVMNEAKIFDLVKRKMDNPKYLDEMRSK